MKKKHGECIAGNKNDGFGISLSTSADGLFMAVGAKKGRYVKVFQRINNDWIQRGDTIVSSLPNFGSSVSLTDDGTSLFVTGEDIGFVKRYLLQKSVWIEASSPTESGYYVSAAQTGDGKYVAVGAADLEYGRVSVYEYDSESDSWLQVGDTIEHDHYAIYFGQFSKVMESRFSARRRRA